MHSRSPFAKSFLNALMSIPVVTLATYAQTTAPNSPAQQTNEVVRVNTQLAQTDVSVLDRSGRFVEGLTREQFELRVNGQKRPISFFERVAVGSSDEEAQLAAARGGPTDTSTRGTRAIPLDRGRVIFFYLDDYHLSPTSINRVRQALLHFIENSMGQNDEVAIFSASGQLGFLQQLTSERAVLRAAIGKFSYRSFSAPDSGRTPMTEYEALAITREDRRVLDYFVEQLLKEMLLPRPRGPSPVGSRTRSQAETMVRDRARSIVDQTAALTTATLSGLERLTVSSSVLPWRKVIFFVSDGFYLADQDLRRVTDATARSGSVVYSLDARGLSTGVADAATKVAFDSTARLASVNAGALNASQAPLQELAADTGGHAFLNSNALAETVRQALSETSNYYLLAWRPEEGEIVGGKFNVIEVKIAGRPDTTVRFRHGYFSDLPASHETVTAKKKKNESRAKQPDDKLSQALHEPFPLSEIPVSLAVGYVDTSDPLASVMATIEADRTALDLASGGPPDIELEILGTVINEQGKTAATFDQGLTIASSARRVVYNRELKLAPGLYQIRIAVQERKHGRIGSATQWIDVPDIKNGPFALSSLFLGEVDPDALQSGKLQINADHRFHAGSRIGFMTYIYNAQQKSAVSDVAFQIQVLRDDQPVVTKPLFKVEAAGALDPTRIPYGEDFSLADLPPGKYVLQITAIDRLAKKSVTGRAGFLIY